MYKVHELHQYQLLFFFLLLLQQALRKYNNERKNERFIDSKSFFAGYFK